MAVGYIAGKLRVDTGKLVDRVDYDIQVARTAGTEQHLTRTHPARIHSGQTQKTRDLLRVSRVKLDFGLVALPVVGFMLIC
tara:strand:+ start:221 stop:463 length:243 start_codon:yes stop_codon:yes gene_type:complete